MTSIPQRNPTRAVPPERHYIVARRAQALAALLRNEGRPALALVAENLARALLEAEPRPALRLL